MATYTYDDGSTISNDFTPSGWVTSATEATDSGISGWSDSAEAAKLNRFYPQGGGEWWQQAAMYGLTRGIDAAFASATVNKTAAPATYAGQNGKTYVNGQQPGAGGLGGNTGVLLLVVAAVALVALS